MNDCCATPDSKTTHPHKHRCPANGLEYAEVSARTISHHIKNSWHWQTQDVRYFFCDDPNCDVVYFDEHDSVILKSQLRTQVGIKETSDDALLCYCFGVTKADAHNDSNIKNFVMQETKLKRCSCDTRNPSGRCCLKDFPHHKEDG